MRTARLPEIPLVLVVTLTLALHKISCTLRETGISYHSLVTRPYAR